MKIKVTQVQANVLKQMSTDSRLLRPRSSLDLLQKKGLVDGDRRTGWVLTPKGLRWLKENEWTK